MLPIEDAQKYLHIVRKRGEAKATLNRVYTNMRKHKGLFLLAYANLYANKGALTPGIDPQDTVDGMSMKKIDAIIDTLTRKAYRWSPVKRTYIAKRHSTKQRPLGMPGWTDKLLQEVIRLILSAYYEPQFRDCSHGFRPQRGCHTALDTIKTWKGTRWFVEGDIKGCFDGISHKIVYKLLSEKIKDRDFLRLIEEMLRAGYMEDWRYHTTYSGTPQGGIVSPLLMNIVLNELDMFIEDELILQYTKGKKRKKNPEYQRLVNQAYRARKAGRWKQANELKDRYLKLPATLSNDPGYRRLWYVRYADDFLLGLIGTKQDADMIRERIGRFLQEAIELEMSEEKTFVTHALTEKARFLNYEINLIVEDTQVRENKDGVSARTINGKLWFSVPEDVVIRWTKKVSQRKKIIHRRELLNGSDYDIISLYEVQLQGLINYYSRAHNVVKRMGYLRYIWEESLTKTLAAKYKTRATTIRRKYRVYTADGRKVIGVAIPREGKKPLQTAFGKKPITRKSHSIIQDNIQTIYAKHTELLTRMLAEVCELCGSTEDVQAHHIRKLADLKKKYQGRKEPPKWVKKMIAIRRKTLFVCQQCHNKIHSGTYDGVALTKV